MEPAVPRTASREFQVFVKPAGAACNLDCRYCYYLKKRDLYPETETFRMSDDLLEEYIRQHIAASPTEAVTFSWHGGEPTVLGLDFFRRVVALQRKHQPEGRRIVNGIQTNGLLLDEDWCRFLADEGFGVGLSLDGPPELHDEYRVNRGGEATHRQTLRAFELLARHRVPCDILCVVHDRNVRRPLQVYRFFKEIGAQYLGFLPIVEPLPGAERGVTPQTVPAEAFGAFLCAIFDEWMRGDTRRIMVQMFDEAARPVMGMEHSLCIFRETCGELPVLEHNGDFYSCDHFVDPAHRVGNIRETPLVDLIESTAQRVFGQAKRDRLPAYCLRCRVLDMCNGGCPKDRFILTPEGEPGLNYLCAGYQRFFAHSRRRLEQLAAQAPGDPAPPAAPALRVGRNDPCPCGSGRKYKKCCGVP
jgi:uncharacterized protein